MIKSTVDVHVRGLSLSTNHHTLYCITRLQEPLASSNQFKRTVETLKILKIMAMRESKPSATATFNEVLCPGH